MSQPRQALKTKSSQTAMQKILDAVERVGNNVPHPVVIFLILIVVVLALSHVLYALGATVSYQVINPDTHEVETATTA
jgi:aminobenzoyl-glutamate transport protein